MDIWKWAFNGGKPLDGGSAEKRKIVSLTFAAIMIMPLGGYLSHSPDDSKFDNSTYLDVTIHTVGSISEESSHPGHATHARIEISDRRSLGVGHPFHSVPYARGEETVTLDPNSSPSPNPLDAPFLPNDILVYDDINNQSRPDLESDARGDSYSVFEHYEAGDMDIMLAKSVDGGMSWNAMPLANSSKNESCPSITIDYSTIMGSEMSYVFYENDELEFAWSSDGSSWFVEDFGGGQTWWSSMKCPIAVSKGDLVVVVGQYSQLNATQNKLHIFYTMDGFLNTTSYTFTMANYSHVSQPTVTIIDEDEVFIGMDIHNRADADPAKWWHDSLFTHGILTGNSMTDDWDYWVWGSGMSNTIPTSPSVAAEGHAVVLVQEALDPNVGPPIGPPTNTSWLFCVWTGDIRINMNGTKWNTCNPDQHLFLAFDGTNMNHQKFPTLHWEGSTVNVAWLNGTNINYIYSLDNGANWRGDPATGDPFKVNQPGVGTALEGWHSPAMTFANGRPGVVWHDTRGNGSIYYQRLGTMVIMTFDVGPSIWELWIRKVGDPWHPPPYSYLCLEGTSLEIEVISLYEITNDTRYTFKEWDDGNTSNPRTFICSAANTDYTAIFNVEYWLAMINPGGITVPTSGYQSSGSLVTIEAFSPGAPPSGRYVWLGWMGVGSGGYTGPMNPCTSCVNMNDSITQIALWQLQWEVTLETVPVGLVIEVNGQPYVSPSSHWFNDSDEYTVYAPSPQAGGPGGQYEFSHWSDGGAQQHNVSVMSGTTLIAYFVMINAAPGPPGVSGCELTGTQLEDVTFNWSLSSDDGGGDDDVVSYEIYYGTDYDPGGLGYLLLDTLMAGSTSFVHIGGGHGDNDTYFYRVCAVDGIGQTTCDSQQASKFAKHLNTGMHLLSIPLVPSDTSIRNVLQTVSFERVIYYDAMAGKRHNWRTFDTRKPYSDLKYIDSSMAVWVEVNSDSQLSVAGLVPLQTSIHLVVGWNLVGYPSFINRTVGGALAGATYQNVETYDPTDPPWFLKRLSDTDLMWAGEGYWIHVSSDFDWVLSN
jgi:hypothetical protein